MAEVHVSLAHEEALVAYDPQRVTFVCAGNSARSQMVEIFAGFLSKGRPRWD